MSDWIEHDGRGRPLPDGTLIDRETFDGQTIRATPIGGLCLDVDGTPIDKHRARWSQWHYADGGPMGPKVRRYRRCVSEQHHQRNATMFRSWLRVREEVTA